MSYQEGKPFDQEGKARSFSDAYNVSFAANVVNEPSNSTATQSAGTNTSADSTATLASTENSGTTATSESTATSETTATVEPTATPNEDSNSAKEISIEAGSPGSRDDDYFPEPQVQLDKDES